MSWLPRRPLVPCAMLVSGGLSAPSLLPVPEWPRYTYDDEYSEYGSEDEQEYIGDWKVGMGWDATHTMYTPMALQPSRVPLACCAPQSK
jgi:hypothetical protein